MSSDSTRLDSTRLVRGIGVKWSGNGGLAGHGQPKLEGMGKFYLALLQKARAALGGEDGQQLRWVANVIRLQA